MPTEKEQEMKEQPQPDPQAAQTTEQLAALQRDIDALKAKNSELIAEQRAAKKKAEAAALDAAKKGGDLDAIEKSWKEKLDSTQGDYETKIKQYETMVSAMTAGQQAVKIAAEIALPGSADVLLPHINQRLTTEIKDGKAVVRVLGKDGMPSAMSVDDLKKEFVENKAFAPLLVGSLASGGGKVNGAGGEGKSMQRSAFEKMDPTQKMKFVKDGGTIFD